MCVWRHNITAASFSSLRSAKRSISVYTGPKSGDIIWALPWLHLLILIVSSVDILVNDMKSLWAGFLWLSHSLSMTALSSTYEWSWRAADTVWVTLFKRAVKSQPEWLRVNTKSCPLQLLCHIFHCSQNSSRLCFVLSYKHRDRKRPSAELLLTQSFLSPIDRAPHVWEFSSISISITTLHHKTQQQLVCCSENESRECEPTSTLSLHVLISVSCLRTGATLTQRVLSHKHQSCGVSCILGLPTAALTLHIKTLEIKGTFHWRLLSCYWTNANMHANCTETRWWIQTQTF